jgi:signal transduction histidine kinase
VASAAQLAASHARLQAEVQGRVVELDASRRRILAARDDERQRLEHRLHEGTEGRLGELADTLRRSRWSASGQRTREQIARAEAQLAPTLEELRRLAHGLHPGVLSEKGLEGALAALAKDFPIPVQVTVAGDQVPSWAAVVAYFVCAEALANVAKHAGASRVAVSVTAREGRVRVEIEDDGVGGADPARGSGLRGLADRVETVGGTLQVASVPGHGTRLAAEIPLDGEAT